MEVTRDEFTRKQDSNIENKLENMKFYDVKLISYVYKLELNAPE